MLDINFIREKPDLVKTASENKLEEVDVDALLKLDAQRRQLLTETEELRAEQNRTSKEIGQRKKAGEDASETIAAMRELGDRIKQQSARLRELEEQIEPLMLSVPNVPAPNVPVGRTDEDNELVREWGAPRTFDFKPKPHWDLAARLDIIDFERAAKIAGSHFLLFKADGARLERALINFMLDLHRIEHGFTEVSPPFVANRAAMTATGQLPKLEEDMYRCEMDDLFLIPTAEVPVTNIFAGEILNHESLPIYCTAYTPCFRREAGSYGRDTRALMRVHQFDKVEMVKFVRPETSYDELESLLAAAEKVLQLLRLPYRVVTLCTGELSFAAAKCYDIETWAPGIERWMEVSSCSNYEDFQARRADIRFRDENGKVRLVHTLNGSGVALPRTVLSILETYQREDGTVEIPDPLRPYMGGQELIS